MYREIYDLLNKQGKIKTATYLDGPDAGRKYIEGQEVKEGSLRQFLEETAITCEKTEIVKDKYGARIFVEKYQKNPHLIILGGGHVACPVAHIGKMLGFHVTVMDDRAEFVTKERFPDADVRIHDSFANFSERILPYENAYYVVITRGHKGDALCARQILKRPYTYFGMIGSRTKIKLTKELLQKEDFTNSQLDTIYAPIGLPIGGEMPEEIAVSIMAQIVQVKNQAGCVTLDEKVEEAVLAEKQGVMVTVISKRGSSPRGIGSKMFVAADGTIYGSIGGGSVEFEAMNHAAHVHGFEIQSYDLSTSDASNLGMICGGNVEVMFEKTE